MSCDPSQVFERALHDWEGFRRSQALATYEYSILEIIYIVYSIYILSRL